VEDAAQLALLSAMGCDIAQGYHLSEPLPAAEFAPFMRQYAAEAPRSQA
jgi:EAL domain-containing protein (putative c-di-GMP-specific phosphodiesterase class I)